MPCHAIAPRKVHFDNKPPMDTSFDKAHVVTGPRKLLQIVLPDETVKPMLVDPQVPMMDLLVRVCVEFNFNPVEMILSVPTDRYPGYLQYKPSASIRSLNCDFVKLVPKFHVDKNMNARSLKEINELAMDDLCVIVDLPSHPSVALRAPSGCTVANLLEVVCRNVRLSPASDYCLCPKEGPLEPLSGSQLLADLLRKRFTLMRTDALPALKSPNVPGQNKVFKRRAPLPPTQVKDGSDLRKLQASQLPKECGRRFARERSDPVNPNASEMQDAAAENNEDRGAKVNSPVSVAKETGKGIVAGSARVQRKKSKAPSPPIGAFRIDATEGATSTVASDDQTKSVVLASEGTVLSSSIDDTTLLFVDQPVSKEGNLLTELRPQISAASLSRDLKPSDALMGESDKSLSETAVRQQQKLQLNGEAPTLPPLHVLLDFNDGSSCVLSDSCLPSSNTESMSQASLPASPMSNIQLRDPNEAQYPRMVVKNFEDEYYSTQRTDDYLSFIRFGYRGEAPKSPEPRRRQSMPTQGNVRLNHVTNSRRGCLLSYGKPVGPAATISRFGLQRSDRRPPLFGASLVNDLEREYEKLQSIFAAWQLCLKSDPQKATNDNDARAEAEALQRAILTQHQLLRGICERILLMSPTSFEKAGRPNVSDVLEQMKKTEQQMSVCTTKEATDALAANEAELQPVVQSVLSSSSGPVEAMDDSGKKSDFVAGLPRSRRTSYKKYREFLGSHPSPSPESPPSCGGAALELSSGVFSSGSDYVDSSSAKGTPTVALRTSRIRQDISTPCEAESGVGGQAQKALLLKEIETFGGSSGLRRTPNSAKSPDGVFTFKQFE